MSAQLLADGDYKPEIVFHHVYWCRKRGFSIDSECDAGPSQYRRLSTVAAENRKQYVGAVRCRGVARLVPPQLSCVTNNLCFVVEGMLPRDIIFRESMLNLYL